MSVRPFMKKEREISQEMFGRFIAWLNPDPELAGRRYEDIRRRLILMFTCRGCATPEDLTDETINRVILKAWEIASTYVGDPALYFYGVAHKVHLEFCRRKPDPAPPPRTSPPDRQEETYVCLEKCLQQLAPKSRDLVLTYYQEEKSAKIASRQKLAERMGIPINALRIRAHRIRLTLQDCVFRCLQKDWAA